MARGKRPKITIRSRLTPDPMPRIGERVGVRLFVGYPYECIQLGTVNGLHGWIKEMPVWVRSANGVGSWFALDRIIRNMERRC